MSLLDTANEDVVVYPEEETTDADDNIKTRPAAVGISTRARIEPANQSGTSARRAEQDNEGFETEQLYTLKFPRAFDRQYGLLGAQSQIQWRGKRWALHGDAVIYNRSPNTAHHVYTIRRF